MMSPATMTDGGGSPRAEICSSKSLPESKSAGPGISSMETCLSKACRANGGKVRKSFLLDRTAFVPFSIASRSLFLSVIRLHRIERLLNLRVQEQFAAPAMAEARRGLYPQLAEDFQNGLLVLTPVQLFVSQKQRCQSDIKAVPCLPDVSHRRFFPTGCEPSHQEQSFQNQQIGLADSVGLHCRHLRAKIPKRRAPDGAIGMDVGPWSGVIVRHGLAGGQTANMNLVIVMTAVQDPNMRRTQH